MLSCLRTATGQACETIIWTQRDAAGLRAVDTLRPRARALAGFTEGPGGPAPAHTCAGTGLSAIPPRGLCRPRWDGYAVMFSGAVVLTHLPRRISAAAAQTSPCGPELRLRAVSGPPGRSVGFALQRTGPKKWDSLSSLYPLSCPPSAQGKMGCFSFCVHKLPALDTENEGQQHFPPDKEPQPCGQGCRAGGQAQS